MYNHFLGRLTELCTELVNVQFSADSPDGLADHGYTAPLLHAE